MADDLLRLGLSWQAWLVAGGLALAGAGYLIYRLRLRGLLIVLAAPVAAALVVAATVYLIFATHTPGDIGPRLPPEVVYVVFLPLALLCVPLGLAAVAGLVLVLDLVRERGPFSPPRVQEAVLPTTLADRPPRAPPRSP